MVMNSASKSNNSKSSKIRIIDYSKNKIQELEIKDIKKCIPFLNKKSVTWIDVIGVKDVKLLNKLGRQFDLHPLVIEDIIHTKQRPKLEDYDDYIYIVTRMLFWNDAKNCMKNEQISLILGKNYIISFQENEEDVFGRVRDHLRKDKGKLRGAGADFLAYSLLDEIVDQYFLILEHFGEKVESVESNLLKHPDQKILHPIRKLKKEILLLRRSAWPLREVIMALEKESRNKNPLISDETAIYLRDVYDHTVQVVDTVETYRDSMSGMFDIYLSSVSNKLNEVMKVLTIIGTIFIPLTFITGVYGMNFGFMPELTHPLGYFLIWGVMISIAVVMLIYFKTKQWI